MVVELVELVGRGMEEELGEEGEGEGSMVVYRLSLCLWGRRWLLGPRPPIPSRTHWERCPPASSWTL